MSSVISHEDVTTLMRLVAEIRDDLRFLRDLVREGDDEEDTDDESQGPDA